MKLSAVITIIESEKNILRVVESVAFADEVVVLHSGIEDRVINALKTLGVRVYYKKYMGYGKQKNYAMSKATKEWMLNLSGDEIVTPELKNELTQRLNDSETHEDGFYIARKNLYYPDKWLRFGGQYPNYQLRLFRKGKFDETGINESASVKGKLVKMKNRIRHYAESSIRTHMERVNNHTELEAKISKKTPTGYSVIVKPCLSFIINYFFKLGFLDGWQGLVYHYVSSREMFIKEVKSMETKGGVSEYHLFRTILKRSK